MFDGFLGMDKRKGIWKECRSGQHLVKEPTEPDGIRRYVCGIWNRPRPAKVPVRGLHLPSLTRKRSEVQVF